MTGFFSDVFGVSRETLEEYGVRLKVLFAVATLAVAPGCARNPTVFAGAPFPMMTALTCELASVHDGALNPGYQRGRSSGSLTFTVANLDRTKGNAQLIGNSGASTVQLIALADQLQFLEVTPSGNLNVLIVFAPPEPGALLPVVHSRHVLISPANVAISQYAGSCTPKL